LIKRTYSQVSELKIKTDIRLSELFALLTPNVRVNADDISIAPSQSKQVYLRVNAGFFELPSNMFDQSKYYGACAPHTNAKLDRRVSEHFIKEPQD
jgi:hypothetical protein